MNWYPEQLKAITIALEKLNEVDKALVEAFPDGIFGMPIPYLKMPLTFEDSDGTAYGTFSDEIGGSWSWTPPQKEDHGES